MAPYLGSVRSSDYSEQRGNMAAMEHKRQFLLSLREAIGDDKPLISAIGIRPKATPELVRKGVVISCECGADGLGLGHYDGASMSLLRAIRAGLEDADARSGPLSIRSACCAICRQAALRGSRWQCSRTRADRCFAGTARHRC